jgi:hypothetical protein
LHARLVASKALAENDSVQIYVADDVATLTIEKLVYFAASVFWRAAVRDWSKTGDRINLGPYEESLRRFLLDEQPFPTRMAMGVLVSASLDEDTNRLMTLPWLAGTSPCHRFRLELPGLLFALFVGGQIPPECIRRCAARTGTIAISSAADEMRLRSALEMLGRAEAKGKLAVSPRQ